MIFYYVQLQLRKGITQTCDGNQQKRLSAKTSYNPSDF